MRGSSSVLEREAKPIRTLSKEHREWIRTLAQKFPVFDDCGAVKPFNVQAICSNFAEDFPGMQITDDQVLQVMR